MRLHTIDTGYFKLDGGAMFGVVPKSIWHKLNPPDANNLCTWSMRCMLIEDSKQLVLIDCGLGNKQSEKFFSYYEPHGEASLEKSLKQLGYHSNDITDVLLTHLHFDHCGGAICRNSQGNLEPVFKNATYWSNALHWQWATQPNAREKASFLSENILPIQESGRLKFADNNTLIHPSISLKTVSGHTESMFIPHIRTGNKTIVYCADLFPSMAHIPLPYVMAYDTRPLLTLTEKQSFLQEAVASNYYLFFEHDRTIELCSLQTTERGVRENEVLRLSDLQ